MTSDNETVAEIVKELRDEPLAENGAKPWLHYLADRIEAAHRREVADCKAESAYYKEMLDPQLCEFNSNLQKQAEELKREVAELRECLEEAIYSSCVKCTLYNSRRRQCSYSSGACNDVEKWRKTLEGENNEN